MLQYTPPVHGLCINMSDNGRCLWTDSIWRCCVLPLSALNPFSLSLGSWQISRWKAFSPPIRTPSTSSRVSPSLQGESGEWSDYINIHFLFVSPTHLDCGCMPDMLWESHNHIWFTSCMLCVRCLEVFLITFCHIPVTVIYFFYPVGFYRQLVTVFLNCWHILHSSWFAVSLGCVLLIFYEIIHRFCVFVLICVSAACFFCDEAGQRMLSWRRLDGALGFCWQNFPVSVSRGFPVIQHKSKHRDQS